MKSMRINFSKYRNGYVELLNSKDDIPELDKEGYDLTKLAEFEIDDLHKYGEYKKFIRHDLIVSVKDMFPYIMSQWLPNHYAVSMDGGKTIFDFGNVYSIPRHESECIKSFINHLESNEYDEQLVLRLRKVPSDELAIGCFTYNPRIGESGRTVSRRESSRV